MRIMKIDHDSIVDGEGLRTVIFFAGCKHSCDECHNPESWNFKAGRDWTVEEVISDIQSNPLSQGVTFSGGCPMCNAESIIPLAIKLKELNYNIWCYCGETLEELTGKQIELLQFVDVLVDGEFRKELKDLTLEFRGSSNQRILKKGKDY